MNQHDPRSSKKKRKRKSKRVKSYLSSSSEDETGNEKSFASCSSVDCTPEEIELERELGKLGITPGVWTPQIDPLTGKEFTM